VNPRYPALEPAVIASMRAQPEAGPTGTAQPT
jgi:hypothetical protein